MISETSYEAFKSIQGKLSPKQRFIYTRFLIYGDMTNEELANLTGMKEKSVTPRTGELLAIVDAEKNPVLLERKTQKLSACGKKAWVLGVVDKNKQIEMFRG